MLATGTELRWHWIAFFAPNADPAPCRHWTGRRYVPALAARGLLDGRPIAGPDWADTGKISYALGGNPDVLCLNTDDREFGFGRTPADVVGQDILIVAPRLSPAQIQARYGAIFDTIETLAPVTLGFPGRSGQRISAICRPPLTALALKVDHAARCRTPGWPRNSWGPTWISSPCVSSQIRPPMSRQRRQNV